MYKSERVTGGAPCGQLPAPFLADLGGGVKALAPTALFVHDKAGPPLPRSTRIGDVIIAWNIFQHFYPYFDVVRTDWPKALATALQSAAADKYEEDFAVTLRRLVAALNDGHGNVAPGPDGVPAPLAWDWVADRLIVTFVPDPQGQPIAPQWIRYRALNELGLGPLDQPLVLEIESFRQPVERRTVTLKRKAGPTVEPRPEKVSDLKPGIVYMDLSRISDDDWKAALPKLENAKGIVFDLRGYPRVRPTWLTHLSEKPTTSAQWHVPLITEPDGKNMAFTRKGDWKLEPAKPYLKAKRATAAVE